MFFLSFSANNDLRQIYSFVFLSVPKLKNLIDYPATGECLPVQKVMYNLLILFYITLLQKKVLFLSHFTSTSFFQSKTFLFLFPFDLIVSVFRSTRTRLKILSLSQVQLLLLISLSFLRHCHKKNICSHTLIIIIKRQHQSSQTDQKVARTTENNDIKSK